MKEKIMQDKKFVRRSNVKSSTVYSKDNTVRGTFDITHGRYKFSVAGEGGMHLGYVSTKSKKLAQEIANACREW